MKLHEASLLFWLLIIPNPAGAAPVDTEVLAFFWDRGIPVCNDYGLSETTGPAHFCLPSVFRLEESPVGVTMSGVEVKVNTSATAAGSEGSLNAGTVLRG
jgi:long-subunit acyl-CoA synthetase (AMP-forming)